MGSACPTLPLSLSRALVLGALTLNAVACSEYGFAGDPDQKPVLGDTGEPDPGVDSGYGDPDMVRDRWELDDEGGADLLFFGDTSGSMSEELTTMGEKITALLDALALYTSDWQMLAVTGPTGCGVGGVITPATPDYAALFATGLLTPPGEDDVDEWGLNNVATAVESTDAGECNEGFLREDARLHVIIISDEDDNSPGWDAGDPLYWLPYVDRVLASKGDADLVRISAISGPVPDGCAGAEPGLGYADAVVATGGVQLSICDAWYDEIDSLVDVSVETTIFPLSEMPRPSTITVNVNGVLIAGGWEWVRETNTVLFTESPPVTGDVVEIDYMPDRS